MRLAIQHRTEYCYSHPVFLEPLTLRLRPRCDVVQTLDQYSIVVHPAPTGISHCVDLDGNGTDTVWFNGVHEQLVITVNATVLTHRSDPFDFLITDTAALTLPLGYEQRLLPSLAPYLQRQQENAALAAFSRAMQTEAGGNTVRFLSLLAEHIRSAFQYSVREQGEAWTPETTLEKKSGACRDFAMLYIDACRCAGIAARFVSGYSYADAEAQHHLHAWVEVYLPGAGWRGFDPSEGLAVADRHIAIASGRNAEDASPVFGLYRGDAKPQLMTSLSIAKLTD